MNVDIGEQIVGAYLKAIENCDFVGYNIRPPGGGLGGLNELDVVGLRFCDSTAFICEVTTHIQGMLYGSGSSDTVQKLKNKALAQLQYAEKCLTAFTTKRYMFWSPVVTPKVNGLLKEVEGLELVTNRDYSDKFDELREYASKNTHDLGNDVIRLLQIMQRLRRN